MGGEAFQTLFDEKRLYKLLNVKEQKNGIFIFKAELINKKEKSMTDEELLKARHARLREYSKNRLKGDLRLVHRVRAGSTPQTEHTAGRRYRRDHGGHWDPENAPAFS
jgi:hypothetical protein